LDEGFALNLGDGAAQSFQETKSNIGLVPWGQAKKHFTVATTALA
jgi:hypothetical protein